MLTALRSRIRSRKPAVIAVPVEPALVARVRDVERRYFDISDRELKDRVDDLRGEVELTQQLSDDVITTAFGLIGLAARRALGIAFYDVQFQAGLALVRGQVAEMQTGEGKTFAAAFPAVVFSLFGRGVHVATSNAYLAERDCLHLKPLYEMLGASAGITLTQTPPDQKRAAYQCDITYGPGCDFGFDYLRDQVTLRQAPESTLGADFLAILRGQSRALTPTLQRGLNAVVVDEIDNVLLDDACSPLLISNFSDKPAPDAAAHVAAKKLVDELVAGQDFSTDRLTGAIRLTEIGLTRIWDNADELPLRVVVRPWQSYVEQALRAKYLFRLDVNYIVRDGKVVIVDESTGRIFEERSWRDGLHQAVEAREGLAINAEKESLATVTRQRFYRHYETLCGMTGTATGSEDEFRQIYQLGVTRIPTHRPSRRTILPPRYFATAEAKWQAIAHEVERLHARGQPVLIGTRSIIKSEQLAELLTSRGISFQLLNGKQDEDEAELVAQAGRAGAVMIATNMAGRGTDIKPDDDALSRGGLHVIVSEHHDAQRIDRQLVGRAARQGDVGSAQCFVSADDDWLVKYGDWLRRVMQRAAPQTGSTELRDDFSSSVRKVQAEAEQQKYLERRQLFLEDNRKN